MHRYTYIQAEPSLSMPRIYWDGELRPNPTYRSRFKPSSRARKLILGTDSYIEEKSPPEETQQEVHIGHREDFQK